MGTIIITHLNFAKGFRGGERQTQLLIEKLSLNGWNQILIVRQISELGQRCQEIQNLTIIEIPKPYLFSLSKIKTATLLHAHETKAAQFALIANLVYRIPYIVTRRVDNPLKSNFFNRLIYTRATPCVALSRAIKEEILKISPHSSVVIIPSAYTEFTTDNDAVQRIKNRFIRKFLVGHVGALDDQHKGQSTIIEAARYLEKTIPNLHFLLIGGGDDEALLKEKAKHLTNITFEGFVNNVGDYLEALELFVFPSNNEGLGSILFDVMRSETPIIASNVGGIPDIIKDGYNGFLIPPRDPTALIDAIIQLYGDEDVRKKIVDNALHELLHFSPDSMRLSYENLYAKVLKNS
jgi:glycosyltransferase involved in cell wall biosynthesis